jgi:hypothetical protein
MLFARLAIPFLVAALTVGVMAQWLVLFISWRQMRALRRLRLVWLVLCTQAFAMRGWPLHHLLVHFAKIAASEKVSRDGH